MVHSAKSINVRLWVTYQLVPPRYLCFLAAVVRPIPLNVYHSLQEEEGPCTSACLVWLRSVSSLHLLRHIRQIM